MKCPQCGGEMKLANQDASVNHTINQIYKRKIYNCDKDDVWITVETPLKKRPDKYIS